MPVVLTKESVDLGIITRSAEPMLAFYRDLLGLTPVGESPMPGGGTMHRLMAGTSMIKIVHQEATPAEAVPGGIGGATGYRYWTLTVSNLEEITAACEGAGHKVPIPVTALPGGIRISIVEDPDGNWVEFLQADS
ncbi:MAG: VOC family protein [Gammaproteobacteria bacterium AqS3]|nr:VOC family protein [Gammaproteobacteria bacterium AqS3]